MLYIYIYSKKCKTIIIKFKFVQIINKVFKQCTMFKLKPTILLKMFFYKAAQN